MSILLGALGGAGEQLSKIGADRQAFEDKSTLETQQSDLVLKRAQALEQFKQDLAAKPLMRLTDRARQLAGEEVPVESTPVEQVTGEIPLADGEMGPKPRGFTGSIADIRRGIEKLPDGPDKTAAMKQLDAQVSGDQKAADGIIAGARRKRTSREALDAAVDEARTSDLPALAAYESSIGKSERDERRIDATERKAEGAARAAATESERKALADANRLAVEMKRLDLQAGTLEAQNRRIDAWIDNEAAKRENDGKRDNSSPERLYSVINAMNATIRQLTDISGGGKPAATAPAQQKAEWQTQYDTAVRVRARAQKLLDENLSARGATDDAPPAAAPKPAEALPLPREKAALQAGKVYQTSRGPAKWNGTAFEAQ